MSTSHNKTTSAMQSIYMGIKTCIVSFNNRHLVLKRLLKIFKKCFRFNEKVADLCPRYHHFHPDHREIWVKFTHILSIRVQGVHPLATNTPYTSSSNRG